MTDFDTMNKTELRAYLIKHPGNKSAFQAFVDRFTSEADSETYSMTHSPEEIEEVDNLIKQKLKQLNKSDQVYVKGHYRKKQRRTH